jgi:protein-S-isoprenylcysteine O-methyltransferase Ste14
MGIMLQAVIVVPLVIGMLTGIFAVLGYFIIDTFGIPVRFNLPVIFRIAGIGILAFGFAFLGWIYKHRSPLDIIISTYETIRKAINRNTAQKMCSRDEPLILTGPQRYVRNPMYFAVVILVFGWWLLLDYTFIMFMVPLFFFWFTLVVIRFEERELRELFGEEYEKYTKAVPMIIPSLKPRWP